MFYGFREGEDPATDDKDLLLVPKLVDKVVIPRLTGQASWLCPLRHSAMSTGFEYKKASQSQFCSTLYIF